MSVQNAIQYDGIPLGGLRALRDVHWWHMDHNPVLSPAGRDYEALEFARLNAEIARRILSLASVDVLAETIAAYPA